MPKTAEKTKKTAAEPATGKAPRASKADADTTKKSARRAAGRPPLDGALNNSALKAMARRAGELRIPADAFPAVRALVDQRLDSIVTTVTGMLAAKCAPGSTDATRGAVLSSRIATLGVNAEGSCKMVVA